MLKCTEINKFYRNKEVLKSINLELTSGTLVLLSGVNGSGKTTLFKIIAGIIKPTSGKIILDTNVKLGALIENPSFLENETAQFNLEYLSKLNGEFSKSKTSEMMKSFALDIEDKTPVKSFSLGMKQKLGIIQAFMEDQNLILLDEPTRGIDSESLLFFWDLVKSSVNNNKTVVIATHEKFEGVNFDKKYIIQEGILKVEE